MEIHGSCDERFSDVLKAFEDNFKDGGEVGACYAASVEGEMVVDIWGGYRDAERSKPWDEDTIVIVYSTTKTLCLDPGGSRATRSGCACCRLLA